MRHRAALPPGLSAAVFLLGLTAGGALAAEAAPIPGGSLRGTTGHIEVPSAYVTPEGAFRLGVGRVGRERSDIGRPEQANNLYYLTIGFLPSIEVSMRATAFRERDVVVRGEQQVVDRAVCGRLRLLAEGRWPAVAVGADDVKGNRRAHALYAVATKSWLAGPFSAEFTAGFGSRAIRAKSYVLDGAFGAAEWGIARRVCFILENDSQKWNAGVRLNVFQLAAQAAIVGFDTLAGGVAWTRSF